MNFAENNPWIHSFIFVFFIINNTIQTSTQVYCAQKWAFDTIFFSGNAYGKQNELHIVIVDTAEVEARMSVKYRTKIDRKSDESQKTNWCTSIVSKQKSPVGLQVSIIYGDNELTIHKRKKNQFVYLNNRKKNAVKILFAIWKICSCMKSS